MYQSRWLDSAVQKQLAQCLFFSKDPNDRIALIHATLPQALAADKILTALRKEKRQPTAAEKATIDAAEAARELIIQVDSFERLGKELTQPDSWTQSQRPAYTANQVLAAVAR